MCQPDRTDRIEMFMPRAGSREPQALEQRRAKHLGIERARVKRAAAGRAHQPHFAGAEEQRIDLVEVVVVALEDVVERRAVVRRRRRRHAFDQLGQLGVARIHDEARLAAVEHAVVGAADRAQIVLRRRRERCGARRAHDAPDVEAERLHLVEARLDDARHHLHAARQARRRRHGKGEPRRLDARLRRHPVRHVVGRQRAGFEHEHAVRPVLGVPEALVQLLFDPRLGAQRARPHREVALGGDGPAGVLRRHAALGGMVGPDLKAGPRFPGDGERRQLGVAHAAHAQLGEKQTGGQAAGDVHARVEHAGAAVQRVRAHAQEIGVRDGIIHERPGALVQVQARQALYFTVIGTVATRCSHSRRSSPFPAPLSAIEYFSVSTSDGRLAHRHLHAPEILLGIVGEAPLPGLLADDEIPRVGVLHPRIERVGALRHRQRAHHQVGFSRKGRRRIGAGPPGRVGGIVRQQAACAENLPSTHRRCRVAHRERLAVDDSCGRGRRALRPDDRRRRGHQHYRRENPFRVHTHHACLRA